MWTVGVLAIRARSIPNVIRSTLRSVFRVALDGAGESVGTIAVREESVPSYRHLSPWLAGFLVAPRHRRWGIGSALIAELENEARQLGFERIYTATELAIENRGWQAIETPTLRGVVKVYALDL